ncbi:hypothetical protein [Rossellomorea aquimaris]|uniref:hypothetical protein n=1 Tax=Rossellomorea aquimaris TaxID=189382 RepID=UPI0007D067E0|nr:hypothetical protein [Rossellomorea aquimaris]
MQKLSLGVMAIGFIAAIILNFTYSHDATKLCAWLGTVLGICLLYIHSKKEKHKRNFIFFLVCFLFSLTGVFFI